MSIVSHEYGLEINIKKTKVSVTSTKTTVAQVTCDNVPLKQVKSSRYLGSIIMDICYCSMAIMARQ